MTNKMVPTITDDLVAELEASVSSIWPDHDIAVLTLKSLLAERAELKRDAERYRWLRSKEAECNVEIPYADGFGYMHPGYCESLDQSIDTAKELPS